MSSGKAGLPQYLLGMNNTLFSDLGLDMRRPVETATESRHLEITL